MKELYIVTKNAEIKPICYLNSYQKWKKWLEKGFGESEAEHARHMVGVYFRRIELSKYRYVYGGAM